MCIIEVLNVLLAWNACRLFLVGIAHYMENLDVSIKKQIQNELTRSRNSMIKEIRRELFEKMTFAMRSQGV